MDDLFQVFDFFLEYSAFLKYSNVELDIKNNTRPTLVLSNTLRRSIASTTLRTDLCVPRIVNIRSFTANGTINRLFFRRA
jgi:hypothetical protein